MLRIRKVDNGAMFNVRMQPGAPKNDIVGVQGEALKVKINAPPVREKANKALVVFLAEEKVREFKEKTDFTTYDDGLGDLSFFGASGGSSLYLCRKGKGSMAVLR